MSAARAMSSIVVREYPYDSASFSAPSSMRARFWSAAISRTSFSF